MTRAEILQQVAAGKLTPAEAEKLLQEPPQRDWRGTLALGGVLQSIGIGLVFTVVGVWQGVSEIAFRLEAQSTEGTVIRLIQTSRREYTAPIVQFDVDGKKFEVGTRVSPTYYSIGEKVTVFYSPAQPEYARVGSFMEEWLFPIAFSIGGAGCIAMGVAMWRRSRRPKSVA